LRDNDEKSIDRNMIIKYLSLNDSLSNIQSNDLKIVNNFFNSIEKINMSH